MSRLFSASCVHHTDIDKGNTHATNTLRKMEKHRGPWWAPPGGENRWWREVSHGGAEGCVYCGKRCSWRHDSSDGHERQTVRHTVAQQGQWGIRELKHLQIQTPNKLLSHRIDHSSLGKWCRPEMKNGLRFKLGPLEGPPYSIKLLRATCVSTALIWLGSDWCLRTVLLPNDMQIDVHGLSLGGVWVWAARGPCLGPRSCYSQVLSWCPWPMLHRKSSRGPWPALLPEVMLMLVGHAVTGGHTDVSVAWAAKVMSGLCCYRGPCLGPRSYCGLNPCWSLWFLLHQRVWSGSMALL